MRDAELAVTYFNRLLSWRNVKNVVKCLPSHTSP